MTCLCQCLCICRVCLCPQLQRQTEKILSSLNPNKRVQVYKTFSFLPFIIWSQLHFASTAKWQQAKKSDLLAGQRERVGATSSLAVPNIRPMRPLKEPEPDDFRTTKKELKSRKISHTSTYYNQEYNNSKWERCVIVSFKLIVGWFLIFVSSITLHFRGRTTPAATHLWRHTRTASRRPEIILLNPWKE